jgi:hypothetical protein
MLQISATKAERKRVLGKIMCRWYDNIKIDFKETDVEMCTGFIYTDLVALANS